MMSDFLHILPEVQEALKSGQAVVALESTIVAHGMPYPQNLETAQRLESIVRAGGAVPATVAVVDGKLQVGCTSEDLTALATSPDVLKVSRRDLPLALARKTLGATTVSGTLIGCELAGDPSVCDGRDWRCSSRSGAHLGHLSRHTRTGKVLRGSGERRVRNRFWTCQKRWKHWKRLA